MECEDYRNRDHVRHQSPPQVQVMPFFMQLRVPPSSGPHGKVTPPHVAVFYSLSTTKIVVKSLPHTSLSSLPPTHVTRTYIIPK